MRCAGCLDAEYLTATGNGIRTIVSNTNTSKDSEEGLGYGASLLTFATQLANSASIPNVLSLSIGSLSFASCDKMCKMIEDKYSYDKCWAFLTTTQRQVWDRHPPLAGLALLHEIGGSVARSDRTTFGLHVLGCLLRIL